MKKLLIGLAIGIMMVTLGSYANATTLRYTISGYIGDPAEGLSLDVWFDFDDAAGPTGSVAFEPVSDVYSTWYYNGTMFSEKAQGFIDDNIQVGASGSLTIWGVITFDDDEHLLNLGPGAVNGVPTTFKPASGWDGITTFGEFMYNITNTTISPVPEPATMLLFGLGLLGLAGVNRRKK